MNLTEKAFDDKNINEKVSIFINTINNFLSNFIPHEIITCDDRNPPWFINEIEKLKRKSFFTNCTLPVTEILLN